MTGFDQLLWLILPAVALLSNRTMRLLRGVALLIVGGAIALLPILTWFTPERWPGVLAFLALTGGLITSRKVWHRWQANAAFGVVAAIPALTCLTVLAVVAPNSDAFGNVIDHGPRTQNTVAITFDDGPDPTWTPQIEAILDSAGVKGTFFEVGRAVEAHPDIVKSLVSDGHEIANHSYTHGAWDWLKPSYNDGARAEEAFKATVDLCPALFRPPHGSKSPMLLESISNLGLETVTWDVTGHDWQINDPEEVARQILDAVKPGSIILLHDAIAGTSSDRSVVVKALPIILSGLKARGLTPVRLDQLLSTPAYLPQCQ